MPNLTPKDFMIDDKVIYIPGHANDDISHADCEHGIVTSINHVYVFVKFETRNYSCSCYPDSLVKVNSNAS